MGAEGARVDADLDALDAPLAAMASRVPAVEGLQQRLGRLRQARGPAAAEDLLAVAAVATQFGGARATLAEAPGPIEPLPAHPGVRCDDAPEEVERAREALRGGGWTLPPEGVPLDLRLIGLWVEALGHQSEPLHRTALTVLPARAGILAVPYLCDGLDLGGGPAHGRRIELLAAILGPAARARVDEALAQGSPVVAASALRALATLAPAEAETRALALLEGPVGPMFEAACGILAGSTREGAIDALLKYAVSNNDAVAEPALRALGACRGERVSVALAAMIPAEIGAIREISVGFSRGFSAASEAVFDRFTRVLPALRGHLDGAMSERLGALVTGAASAPVRRAAREAMIESGSNVALGVLCRALRPGDPYQDEVNAVRRAIERGDAGVLPVLETLVDRLDKADRELVYLGMIQLDARSEVPWLRARSRVKGLHDRELSLVRQALAALT
jgi:uracil-DNA glycosylase